MDDDENKTTVDMVDKGKTLVDQLYEFRDHYFENFGLERSVHKAAEVRSKMEETFSWLEKHPDMFPNKSEYYMLLGKVLNVTTDFAQRAEDHLSKAVKLDPKLVEGWNQLGESYWKKGDINNAKNCFTGALVHLVNKVSLRNLSMVLRQVEVPPEEKCRNIESSVDKAKEAIQLDITDGTSWLILGNAYLSLFFTAGQNPTVLSRAMSAYKQAEKDPVARNSGDLHYNRAMAYTFEENYQAALEGFSQAALLDASWNDPSVQERRLLLYLTSVTQLIEAKGKIKGKRLQNLAQSPRESALGPYAGGSYTSSAGNTIKLMRCLFSDLDPELNSEKVVTGKVVCTVPNDDPVPFTFCMLDEEETCLPVNVYNLAQGCGVKIGDTVAMPEPYIQHVKVTHKGKAFDYRSVRVNTPLVLVVNGRKLGRDKLAGTILKVSTVSD